MVNNPPANTEHKGDADSIPGLERFPGWGNGNPRILLPGKFHRQKSVVGDSPCSLKELDTTEHIHTTFIKIDVKILNKILLCEFSNV